MSRFFNKKIILGAGCLALFFPGAFVFGFPGVMAGQWQAFFHVNKAQIGRIMFYILAGTGCSMYLAGKLLEKLTPRLIILTGNLACSSAMIFVARASSMDQVYLWAFIEGFFCGFVYIPCLSIFQGIFPGSKGLVTGILNLTFGGSSAVMSPVFAWVLLSWGYGTACYTAAFASLFAGIAAFFVIKVPDVEKGYCGPEFSAPPLSLINTFKLHSFWLLWVVWALAGASGISLIVLASSFGRHLGYGIRQYIYILTAFNVLNGIGHIICGRLADQYRKQKIMACIFSMAGLAYILMPYSDNIYVVSFLACFVGLAFGGLFTVSAPLVTEVFGLENFGRIFGLVFTAYGFLAGFLGPWMSGMILDATGSDYRIVFTIFAVFYFVSTILIMKISRPEKIWGKINEATC